MPLLLHRTGNLLSDVAAFFVTSVCRLLSVSGRGAGRKIPTLKVAGLNPTQQSFTN